jgi:hypothetical protein
MSGWYWGNLLFGEVIKNKTGFVVVLESELTSAERVAMVRVN